jgi:threonine synthase
VLIPHDLEVGKVLGSMIYAPHLVRIDGTYDDVNRLCSEIADRHHWAFVNVNIRPYYAEGSKTYGYEIQEQLGWRTPAHVVVPMASGSLLTKIGKSIEEFTKLGLVEAKGKTRLYGAQAAGCGPIAEAVLAGRDAVKPVKQPNTIAKSLAIGNPADGPRTARDPGRARPDPAGVGVLANACAVALEVDRGAA